MKTPTSEQPIIRRCKELCTHPSLPLTASVVGVTQNLKHPYTNPPTSMTTQLRRRSLPPHVQLGFSPHAPACDTKQNTCMFWLGTSDTRCQIFARHLYPTVSAPNLTPKLFATIHKSPVKACSRVVFELHRPNTNLASPMPHTTILLIIEPHLLIASLRPCISAYLTNASWLFLW